MIKFARFNIYLCCALGFLLFTGCQTMGGKKDKKELTTIELHLEVNQDGASDNGPVPIGRDSLFQVNVDKAPFTDTANVIEAKLMDEVGGFVIQLKFDLTGLTILDMMTTSYRGKRIAVFCKSDKERWLAAPIITKRIKDGIFRFTPDATREEAERIVKGLNNAIEQIKKSDKSW